MLVIVVIMFGVCWLPLHTFFLVLDFNPELTMNASTSDKQIFTMIYYAVFWLAMSNSCANPIIYGFTNDSFRNDLASVFYMWFPFCLCLKHAATRRLSVSTFESVHLKRFGTARKNHGAAVPRQAGYKDSSRVYLDLQRDAASGRNLCSMNQLYKHSDNNLNVKDNRGEDRYQPNTNHCRQKRSCHHLHPYLNRTESGDSTVAFTSPNHNEYQTPSLPSANGSHIKLTSASQSSHATFAESSEDASNYFNKLNTMNRSSVKLCNVRL